MVLLKASDSSCEVFVTFVLRFALFRFVSIPNPSERILSPVLFLQLLIFASDLPTLLILVLTAG